MLQESLREKFLSVPSDKNIPAFWPAEKTKYQSLLCVFFSKPRRELNGIQAREEHREDTSNKPQGDCCRKSPAEMQVMQCYLPEIAPKIGDYVAMFAFFYHIYFLLDQRKVIP